jgi:hypothetical protein
MSGKGDQKRFVKASSLLAAEMIGGAAVIGTSQSASTYGLGAALFNLGLALSLLVGVFAYIYIYRPLSTFSVPEATGKLFGKGFEKPVLLLLALVYIGILSVEMAAASGIISKLLNITDIYARAITFALILLPSIGGFRLTSAWNAVLGTSLLLLLGIVALGAVRIGPCSLKCSLPPPKILVMWLLLNPLSFIASQPLIQSSGWCDDEDVKPWKAALFAFPFVVLVGILSAFITVSTGASAGRATIFAAAIKVGHTFGVVISVVAVSAILTTAPTILVAVSTLISELFGLERTSSGSESARLFGTPTLASALLLSWKVKSILTGLSYSFAPRAILGVLIAAFFISRFRLKRQN